MTRYLPTWLLSWLRARKARQYRVNKFSKCRWSQSEGNCVGVHITNTTNLRRLS